MGEVAWPWIEQDFLGILYMCFEIGEGDLQVVMQGLYPVLTRLGGLEQDSWDIPYLYFEIGEGNLQCFTQPLLQQPLARLFDFEQDFKDIPYLCFEVEKVVAGLSGNLALRHHWRGCVNLNKTFRTWHTCILRSEKAASRLSLLASGILQPN